MATKKALKTSLEKQSKKQEKRKSGNKQPVPVSKEDRKATSKKIRAIEKKHNSVSSAQKTIPYLEMYKDGICRVTEDYYLNLDENIFVNIHLRSWEQQAAVKWVKLKNTAVDAMKIDEQKKAARSGYDIDILPPDLVSCIFRIS